MLKFSPFGDHFEAGMRARALGAGDALIDLEPSHYAEEVRLKRSLLQDFPGEYYRGGPELMAAQWEVLELVLENLAGHYPEHFKLERRGAIIRWHNNLLGETHDLIFGDASSLPLEPLDWAGRQVQEDLVLVSADVHAAFVGGQLCFPNGWSLPDRLGGSFMSIHTRTPQTTMPSVHAGARLLSTMKPGKTVWRTSWNFKLSAQLDLSTKHKAAYKADFAARAPLLSAESAGHEVTSASNARRLRGCEAANTSCSASTPTTAAWKMKPPTLNGLGGFWRSSAERLTT